MRSAFKEPNCQTPEQRHAWRMGYLQAIVRFGESDGYEGLVDLQLLTLEDALREGCPIGDALQLETAGAFRSAQILQAAAEKAERPSS